MPEAFRPGGEPIYSPFDMGGPSIIVKAVKAKRPKGSSTRRTKKKAKKKKKKL
jgi:hypothetical protein